MNKEKTLLTNIVNTIMLAILFSFFIPLKAVLTFLVNIGILIIKYVLKK